MSSQLDAETKREEEAHLYNPHLVQAVYVSQSGLSTNIIALPILALTHSPIHTDVHTDRKQKPCLCWARSHSTQNDGLSSVPVYLCCAG